MFYAPFLRNSLLRIRAEAVCGSILPSLTSSINRVRAGSAAALAPAFEFASLYEKLLMVFNRLEQFCHADIIHRLSRQDRNLPLWLHALARTSTAILQFQHQVQFGEHALGAIAIGFVDHED